jgi:hypothetical protein
MFKVLVDLVKGFWGLQNNVITLFLGPIAFAQCTMNKIQDIKSNGLFKVSYKKVNLVSRWWWNQ